MAALNNTTETLDIVDLGAVRRWLLGLKKLAKNEGRIRSFNVTYKFFYYVEHNYGSIEAKQKKKIFIKNGLTILVKMRDAEGASKKVKTAIEQKTQLKKYDQKAFFRSRGLKKKPFYVFYPGRWLEWRKQWNLFDQAISEDLPNLSDDDINWIITVCGQVGLEPRLENILYTGSTDDEELEEV